jgi:hypothetical protein
MYGGFSKSSGDIIGIVAHESFQADYGDAFDTAQGNEALSFVDEAGNEGIATSHLDESTGELKWSPVGELDWVHQRTISMSQMTSMLRDAERNACYEKAIGKIIDNFKQKTQRDPVVLGRFILFLLIF